MNNLSRAGASAPTAVAAYARMSTDQQASSVGHQLAAIHAYASARGMAVVREYIDEARSGLTLAARPGLLGLLAAVTSPPVPFAAIIVYDVSRWGRFQDVDESAHYEYLCRRAGIPVHYCAEPFADDGTPLAALLKGIKRIMAAEYSRELSAKVSLAQHRLSALGFKQGGRPGYGLQRIPVACSGRRGTALAPGERKPMATDHVALAPTPDATPVVQHIYRLYLDEGLGDHQIARRLRQDGVPAERKNGWDAATVRRILTNARYCGELVYNQTTRKLRSRVRPNAAVEWVHCAEALAPMVSRARFDAAQRERARRVAGPDRATVLAALRDVFARHGTINATLCSQAGLPGRVWMHRLFGSYAQAYAEAGLASSRTANGALGVRAMRAAVEALRDRVAGLAAAAGAQVEATGVWNILRLNGTLRVKGTVLSSRRYPDGQRRWRVPLAAGYPDFVIAALLDDDNLRRTCYLRVAPSSSTHDSIFLSADRLSAFPDTCCSDIAVMFGLPGAV